MPRLIDSSRLVAVVISLSATMAVAGCGIGGIDGVELQGGVFDALGVSGAEKKSTKNVKVAARPGLVLPPSEQRLPAPSDSPVPQPAAESWPIDPETQKVRQAALLDKQHKAYCEREMANAQAIGGDPSLVTGPKGACVTGIFGSLTEAVEGKKR